MTKKETLTTIKNLVLNGNAVIEQDGNAITVTLDDFKDEITAYIDNEISLIEKKAEKAKTQKSKTQKENEVFKAEILSVLEHQYNPLNINDIIGMSETFSGFSCQKMSALLKQLVDSGKVGRQIIEKKPYFYLVVEEPSTTDI